MYIYEVESVYDKGYTPCVYVYAILEYGKAKWCHTTLMLVL